MRGTEQADRDILRIKEHATQDRFVYYHRWRFGDVLMWGDRPAMHRPEERRVMLRTILYPNCRPPESRIHHCLDLA